VMVSDCFQPASVGCSSNYHMVNNCSATP
jgi:hypothetical protein